MSRNVDYACFDIDACGNPKVLALIEDGGGDAFLAWHALVSACRSRVDPEHLDRAGLVTVPLARYVLGALGLDPRKMVELLEKHRLLDPMLEPGQWMIHEFIEHQHLREWLTRINRSRAGNRARWGEEHVPQGIPEDILKESPNTNTNTSSKNTSSNWAAADAAEFDRFWAAYPRRIGKEAARKAWAKAVKQAEPGSVLAGAKAFAEQCEQNRTETKFIPHPSTWLNAGRWQDEAEPDDNSGGRIVPASW